MKEIEKRKKIRSLTWSYFIKKKVKEILTTLGVVFALVFLPYWMGKISNSILPSWTNGFCRFWECSKIDAFLIWGIGIVELFILGFVFFLLFTWLKNNWLKAEEKAEEEVAK